MLGSYLMGEHVYWTTTIREREPGQLERLHLNPDNLTLPISPFVFKPVNRFSLKVDNAYVGGGCYDVIALNEKQRLTHPVVDFVYYSTFKHYRLNNTNGLQYFDGSLLILNTWSGNNFFHFIVESATKLINYIELYEKNWPIDAVLINGTDFAKQIVKELLPGKPIISSGLGLNLIAKTALVPSSSCPDWVMPIETILHLRKHFLSRDRALLNEFNGAKRIFVSREDAPTRKISNEFSFFENCLARLGFEKVVLSKLSQNETAHIFSAAECVVGLHGAGLTNIIFCRKGTLIIEISSSKRLFNFFKNICIQADLHHELFLCHSDSHDGDISIDFEKFERYFSALDKAGNKPPND